MSELRFDGQVAVITGAGAGLGRAYALLFASRGAKVVVNDLGGGRHGDGSSTNAADAVVEEIRKQGGTAVADYNSVVEGDKIIQTALHNFGKIDILVNNAGILRDKSFARISDQDWDLVHSVHLKGSFKTTQAAWPVFRKQGYGRIIMTSSNAGVYGNFGQANYSAAKMGLIGLANTIAIEGNKYNIHCNVIVPTAASRLTEDILPTEMFVELKPELIAPVVAYLCHESCDDNGVVIDSAMGWAAKYRIIRSQGSLLRESKGMPVTIENVRDAWPRVTDMTKTAHFDSIQEASASLMTVFSAENKEENEPFIYTSKDLILYALGIGVSIANPNNFQYLYENHEDFKPFPSFFVIPGLMQLMQSSITAEALPHASVSPANILHGEQYLEIVGDLPTEGSLDTQCTVVDVLDKGSGAVVIIDAESYNTNTGEMVVKSQVSTFVVGAGGFRGPRSSSKSIPTIDPPRRGPDAVITQKTTLDQAALYRLSGDVNPLHIDPNMAIMAGYKKPILHGLCTLGFSIKHVIEQYAGNDGSLFKAYKVRFAKPVMPGETLKTEMWKDGNRIYFQTSVVETNTAVIKGGYVDLKSTMPAVSTRSVSASNLKSDVVFEKITEGLKADPAKAKSINGVFVYNITKNGKHAKKWTLDLKTAQIYEGDPKGDKANTTLTISDEDMLDIAVGKLNPQSAFMKGKLKISGNIMLTQKLLPLLKYGAKL